MLRARGKADQPKEPAPHASMPQAESATDDRGPQTASSTMTETQLTTLLGRGSEFTGKLNLVGTARIDGVFGGQIQTSDILVVGEGARVSADITCGSVEVSGELIGDITASESVELHRPARVVGDITTPSLRIERGVTFEGGSKMADVPRGSNSEGLRPDDERAER